MGIVLSNGDSFTYGDELPGSRQEVDQHHHHTFTHKLAEKLNRKYVNLGANGSSNMKIYRRTFDFLMTTSKEIDLLVINWSNFGRYEICEPFTLESDSKIFIHSESNMNQIIPDHHKKCMKLREAGEIKERSDILKLYTKEVLTTQTQIFYTLTYMTHIQWLCDKLKIPVLQGVIHGDMYPIFLRSMKTEGFDDYRARIQEMYGMLRPECKIGLGYYKDIYKTGAHNHTILPMGHVCENAHTEFADMLYDIIKDERLLDVTD